MSRVLRIGPRDRHGKTPAYSRCGGSLRRRVWSLWIAFCLSCCWSDTGRGESPEIFDDLILPALTKAGCNSGACHGSAAGRGGFRLSLYGQDAAADWARVTRALRGRRVNFSDAEQSLLLRKAGEFVEHGGGMRLDPDGEAYRMIRDWIAAGAKRSAQPSDPVVGIDVEPNRIVTSSAESATVPLAVWALHESGRRREVTQWAVLTPQDPAAVEVVEGDAEGSTAAGVRVHRPGRHVLMVRVRDQVTSIELLRPFATEAPPWVASAGVIDGGVERRLRELGLAAGPMADDQTLLRRVTLDLAGRLPTPRERESFLNDPAGERYELLILRLLADGQTARYWSHWLGRSLRADQLSGRVAGISASEAFLVHLRGSLRRDSRLLPLLADLVAADGAFADAPGGLYYQQGGDGRARGEVFSELMLGSRLRCANCHDHPLDVWTQDDYHGLAALLAGIRVSEGVRWRAGATNMHPATGDPAVPRLPDGTPVTGQQDPRPLLSRWMLGAGRRQVARNWCNRIWAALMGRGLVDPVDDHRVTNPSSHPRLLEELTEDWLAHDTDLWWLVGEIVRSRAYRRASRAGDFAAVPAAKNYALRSAKPLAGAVYLDAVGDVTGRRFLQRVDDEADLRFIDRVDWQPAAGAGRGNAEGCGAGEDCQDDLGETLGGSLARIAGPMLNRRIGATHGRVAAWAGRLPEDAEACVRELYLWAFSREPDREELGYWSAALREADDPSAAWEDLVWGALTSDRFRKNW